MGKIPYVAGQFDEEERLAYENFEKFAMYIPKVYTTYTGTPSGTRIDVRGNNYTGGCECIELKKRDLKADNFGDCFIEPDKYDAMMNYWEEQDCFPIYINFIGDWKNVYVWYLPEINGYSIHRDVWIRHQNGLYSKEDRYGLSWADAHHYVYNTDTANYTETKPKNPKIITKKARKADEKKRKWNAENYS